MEDEYVIQKTNEQVEDAIEQLNNRTAEGWTLGERDGVPVPSTSPYYENNARFFANAARVAVQEAGEAASEAESSHEAAVLAQEAAEDAQGAAEAAAAAALAIAPGQLMFYSYTDEQAYALAFGEKDGSFALWLTEVNP